jgi:hypothetical protein
MESGTGGASFLRVIILSESRLDPGKTSGPDFYVAHLLKDFFWIGGTGSAFHPYLAGGLFAIVNRQKKKPNDCGSKPLWQQPLSIILKRDGTYVCGCCSRENNSLVVHSYPSGVHRREQFRNRDAEVIGKLVAVVRRF